VGSAGGGLALGGEKVDRVFRFEKVEADAFLAVQKGGPPALNSATASNLNSQLRSGFDRLGDGSHWLATAAALLLLLGIFLGEEWRQDGECLRHGWDARRGRCFPEVWRLVLVELVTVEVGITDKGAGRASILQGIA
jgi:hypothetical protein